MCVKKAFLIDRKAQIWSKGTLDISIQAKKP